MLFGMDTAPLHIQKKIVIACKRLADGPVPLGDLAQEAGVSASYFQRIFLKWVGLSPKQYGAAIRDEKMRALLSKGRSITDAFLGAGYETPSRFYENIHQKIGMLPTQFALGGQGATLRVSMGQCSLGEFLIGISDVGICAIDLGDDPSTLLNRFVGRFKNAVIMPASREDDRLVARVVSVLDGAPAPADLPLDVRGTAFQKQVWDALTRIPKGKTATYAEIAALIKRPSAHRAVATACASNQIAVIIPCHRVIRSGGGLSGYRWGVERKQSLLEREIETSHDTAQK